MSYVIKNGLLILALSTSNSYANCIMGAPGRYTCSGETTGMEVLTGTGAGGEVVADVSGTWSATGALGGLLYLNHGTVSKATVENSSTIVWDDAIAQLPSGNDGAVAAVNLSYVIGSVMSNVSYRSTEQSSITVKLNDGLLSGRAIAGIAAYGARGEGVVTIDNAGSIDVQSAIAGGRNNYGAGIQADGRYVTISNSGHINVVDSGNGGAQGIGVSYAAAGGAGASAQIVENSGEIVARSGHNSEKVSAGVRMASLSSIDEIILNNRGLISLSGGQGPLNYGRSAVVLASGGQENTFNVFNSGRIESGDESPLAIVAFGNSRIKLRNSGEIHGAIFGGVLDDSIDLSSGVVVGDLFMGFGNDRVTLSGGEFHGTLHGGYGSGADAEGGDDSFYWTGGSLVGGIAGGGGSDVAFVSSADFNGTEVLDGGDDLSAADGFVDRLALMGRDFTAAGANLLNWEQILVESGALSFSDGALATGSEEGLGLIVADGGRVNGGATFALTGNLEIQQGGVFTGHGGGTGLYTVSSNVINQGLLSLSDGAAGDVFQVNGNYVGMDGVVALDTVLGDDNSATDRLVISGGNASGHTWLQVNSHIGSGATSDKGIEVVVAQNGATTEQDAFSLSPQSSGYRPGRNTLAIGAFDYALRRGGNAGTADSWYLVSDPAGSIDPIDPTGPTEPGPGEPKREARPEIGAYLANLGLLTSTIQQTLHERMGEPQWDAKAANTGVAAWARVTSRNEGEVGVSLADGSGQSRSKAQYSQLQIGATVYTSEDQQWQAGVMATLGRGTSQGFNDERSQEASGRVTSRTAGIYGTWYQNPGQFQGLYVDSWAQMGRFRNKVNGSDGLGQEHYRQKARAASVELGYTVLVYQSAQGKLYVEPQLQATYVDVQADPFTESTGTQVQVQGAGGWTTRVGARLFGHATAPGINRVQPFLQADWLRNTRAQRIAFNDDVMHLDVPEDRYEISAGAQMELNARLSAWGSLGLQFGAGGYRSREANMGLKYSW